MHVTLPNKTRSCGISELLGSKRMKRRKRRKIPNVSKGWGGGAPLHKRIGVTMVLGFSQHLQVRV